MAGRVAGMAEVAGKLGVALEGLQGDDVASMASLRTQLYTAMLGMKAGSMRRAGVSMLESLASLALEDRRVGGSWGNSAVYLDRGVVALHSMATMATNYILTLDLLARTRSSIAARRASLGGPAREKGREARNNLLNRLDQVDRSIEVVRDALVLSLTRSSRPSLPISRTPRGPTKEGEPSVRPPGTLTDSEEEMDSEEELVLGGGLLGPMPGGILEGHMMMESLGALLDSH